MKTNLYLILTLLCLSCAQERETGIIQIDGNHNYPVLELKLNELADITAIPLQLGKDSVLLGSPASNRGNLFVTLPLTRSPTKYLFGAVW